MKGFSPEDDDELSFIYCDRGSLLSTCVYSVMGLEVGQFVVRLVTVTVVTAEGLLS